MTLYPSDYPPDKQTLEVAEWQTQQAASRPTPTGAGTYLPIHNVSAFWSCPPPTIPEPYDPPATPAGAGKILDGDNAVGAPFGKLVGIYPTSEWIATLDDGTTLDVIAGVEWESRDQGSLVVLHYLESGPPFLPDTSWHPTPDRTGALYITGAEGMRLILRSGGGRIYYFDIPGRQYTASLTDIVPTITPFPTYTPAPTHTPWFTDDAPNDPIAVDEASPINAVLRYTISPAGDEDWFCFHTETTSTIRVWLDDLPANYDLGVWSVNHAVRGLSTNPGQSPEQVILENAPPDYYNVVVVGIDGAADKDHPYELLFSVTPP